jgi:hypothetical protein
MIKFATVKELEIIPTAKCFPELRVVARTCGALAAIRQAFRLPEAASTATISGCKSSVREITGKRRARIQTIATASILVLCLGFRRDTVQWNRHSQIAATVTASQTRLRSVSIGSSYAIRGEARPTGPFRRRKSSRINRSLQRRAVRRQTFRFTQGCLYGKDSGDSLRAMNGALSLTTSRGEKHNGLL